MTTAPEDTVDGYLRDLAEQIIDDLGTEPGHHEWTVATAEAHYEATQKSACTVYIEIELPDDRGQLHLVAHPLPQSNPVFDDGAAADRARDRQIDIENGV
ncbi:hypothetical protein [Rhodococcus sp. B10]|uniref:hypothetical protein n=1 Tax=Rhodococcus sp. B10 TaxID=2695876 RepID=UPI00142FE401|nr:hypothetical protein [Rhodococcus sp. B10]NIL77669.1 hypothetical protein [Rhodococcus sp. B10]